jgi:hypothetical protein
MLCALDFVLCALALNYREAVTAQSPGLLQPWVTGFEGFNRNAVAAPERIYTIHGGAIRSGLKKRDTDLPQG